MNVKLFLSAIFLFFISSSFSQTRDLLTEIENLDTTHAKVTKVKYLGEKSGKIGLWIGPGTEAYFSNLIVKTQN